MAIRIRRKKFPVNQAQLEFSFDRPVEADRNHHLGGRSFYFFDFDDNVAYLTTPIVIFHKKTGEERLISSGEWAHHNRDIGKSGPFIDYSIDYNDATGSFRYFRDRDVGLLGRIVGKRQTFIEDIQKALSQADYSWKAPSWNCFFHATYNNRPVSVITARGHNPETIISGIDVLVKEGHLPHLPNFLSIYPVTNPEVRKNLGDKELKLSVADLKKAAIRESVETAISRYGLNPHHRFGMSDDDPKNVELITEEMRALKERYPDMSFFVIQTFKDHYVKTEIVNEFAQKKAPHLPNEFQLNLFE
ncbi:MAG: hypothetical protein Fur0010_26180 [Bdellovibrio sp.]